MPFAAGKFWVLFDPYFGMSTDFIFYFFHRHATGGSIPGVLPRLSDQELNVTLSINNTGNVSRTVDLPVFHES